MKRPDGMFEDAFVAYISACSKARINPERTAVGGKRVVQTRGGAKASAGTHGTDGTDRNGQPCSAALDISVKHDLSDAQIEDLLMALWDNGFAAWHRGEPEFPNNEHIHAIWAGTKMKRSLRNQIHSFLKHRSGLVSDKADAFVRDHLSEAAEQRIRTLFLKYNPAVG